MDLNSQYHMTGNIPGQDQTWAVCTTVTRVKPNIKEAFEVLLKAYSPNEGPERGRKCLVVFSCSCTLLRQFYRSSCLIMAQHDISEQWVSPSTLIIWEINPHRMIKYCELYKNEIPRAHCGVLWPSGLVHWNQDLVDKFTGCGFKP